MTAGESAYVYEVDGVNIHRTEMQDGILVLTNHGRNLNPRDASQSSLERYDFATRFVAENAGRMDLARLIKLNRSKIISSYEQVSSVVNLHSVIFEPEALNFWVAVDSPPATEGRWVGFNLTKDLYGYGKGPEPTMIQGMNLVD